MSGGTVYTHVNVRLRPDATAIPIDPGALETVCEQVLAAVRAGGAWVDIPRKPEEGETMATVTRVLVSPGTAISVEIVTDA